MHAGHLPGYPASAGCVRLPIDFAAKLFSVTGVGTTVIIGDNKSAPSHTIRRKPGFFRKGRDAICKRLRLDTGKIEQGTDFNHHECTGP